jgi:hypothetical protein
MLTSGRVYHMEVRSSKLYPIYSYMLEWGPIKAVNGLRAMY